MTITYYDEVEQGSPEWFSIRCGTLSASEMKLIITPKLKIAANEKERSHVYELAAQRVMEYVEPSFVGFDMMRGNQEEIYARELYAEKYAPVRQVGFITNDKWGFTLGCSPDGLVGDDGGIEAKSRKQKFQMEAIAENEVPEEFMIQIQTILMVTERKWWDFLSYSGGMPMFKKRVEPLPEYQEAIFKAASGFEMRVQEKIAAYKKNVIGLHPTERTEWSGGADDEIKVSE